MNKNKFIKELEKLGFKKDPIGIKSYMYSKDGMTISFDEDHITGIIHGRHAWKSLLPTNFKTMIKYLKK